MAAPWPKRVEVGETSDVRGDEIHIYIPFQIQIVVGIVCAVCGGRI